MTDKLNERCDYILNTFGGDKKPVLRLLKISGKIKAAIMYVEEVTDEEAISRDLIKPLMCCELGTTLALTNRIIEEIVPFAGVGTFDDINKATSYLLDGDAILLIDNEKTMLTFSVKKWSHRGVEEPPTSSVIRGPREGFSEDLKTNLSLLRRRLKTPDLVFDVINVGKYSDTRVAVTYIKGIADEKIISELKTRITKIDIDGILDSSYINAFLQDNRKTVFSQIGSTEKPDIAAGKMLEGRVCVIVDGSPCVLTLPYLFIESFQDSGDYYDMPARRNILRALRAASFLIAVLLPGLYVAMLLFHYDMLPTDFLLTIINARSGIPMNPMLELIVTMLLFEILQEASVRMPRYI